MACLSREYLEQISVMTLRDFFGADFCDKKASIDVDALAADYLGLDVCYMTLSDDGQVLGLTTYNDVEISLYVRGTMLVMPFRKDSVLIEKRLLEHDSNGCRRFTLAHEISHQIIYRLEEPVNREKYHSRLSGGAYSCRDLKSIDDWREWQANALASALLMPRAMVERRLRNFNGGKPLIQYGVLLNYPDRQALHSMSAAMGVSYSAMRIRMRQLGYVLQRPLWEYQDPLNCYPSENEVF